MALKNKEEIKIYYKTHKESIREVAKRFDISYRTLAHWVKNEGWQKGEALESIKGEVVQNKLLKKEFGSALYFQSESIKQQIKDNLGDEVHFVDQIILDSILEDTTSKLLLEAMNLNEVNKNIALSALIAKNEMLKMAKVAKEKGDPILIAAAEKVQRMNIEIKNAIYGKESLESKENPLDSLSTQELEKLLKSL